MVKVSTFLLFKASILILFCHLCMPLVDKTETKLSQMKHKEVNNRKDAVQNQNVKEQNKRMKTIHQGKYYRNTNSLVVQPVVPRIAICIGGQQQRMQPRLLLEGLLKVNEQYRFDLYYNIQFSDQIVYNTDPGVSFNSSTFGKMNLKTVTTGLHEIMKESTNTNIISVRFHKIVPFEEVQRNIGYNLTLFKIEAIKSSKAQATILNMYLHQMRCIGQINAYESRQSFKYDYIISTREDVIFMLPMNLTYALNILDEQTPQYKKYLRNQHKAKSAHSQRKCHMVMKECANFFGFNQRFFIYDRESAELILPNRWKFYQKLLRERVMLLTTEVFELAMAKFYRLRGCPIDINHFAVTAVRPVDGDIYCYPFWEIFKCLPANSNRIIGPQRCEKFIPRSTTTSKV